MREGRGLSPFSPQKGEGLDVGILRIGACPITLKVASQNKEVAGAVEPRAVALRLGMLSRVPPLVEEGSWQLWPLSRRSVE